MTKGGRQRPPFSYVGAALLLAGLLALAAPGPAARAALFHPQTFRLDNGLQVVVIPNHRMPVVTQMLWYKVGSADDPRGKDGLAHMVEHMMFKGTPSVPAGRFSRIVAENGGRENAFTTVDYTVFFQSVAADRLALVMRLESDRMAHLVLADTDFQPERQVVLEERRLRIDSRPEARLEERMTAALFPASPYRHPVIGRPAAIRRYTLADVTAFHKRWYAPNNAILVLAGDITAAAARPLAERYYGPIPARPLPRRHRPAAARPRAARLIILRDPDVAAPSWSRSYPAPSYHAGRTALAYPLQVLAEALDGGGTSRLYQTLVVRRKLAAAVSVGYSPEALGGTSFDLAADPAPGVPLARLRAGLDSLLADVAARGLSAREVARAKAHLAIDAAYARDSLHTGARVLGAALAVGDRVADVEAWPERIAAVTPAEVNAAARAVLQARGAVTGLLLPGPGQGHAPPPGPRGEPAPGRELR
ncbi:protease 3 precursor [mine drainage metagenome]|uniref:Protease 3 n=1 Tax=mine drainage metagenome TaxID=410659 RepID=A0A1J5SHI6_9ZZZZ